MLSSPGPGQEGARSAKPSGKERARRGYSKETLTRAKALRSTLTEAEKIIWTGLRARRLSGFKFLRQQPIGPYIADFVCQQAKLVVELDGSQHVDSAHDVRRDVFLAQAGYRVLRFWNSDVAFNRAGVLEAILAAASDPLPPTASRRAPPSPLKGEG
jgi:very-short-patch-repair endonuclease